MSAGSSPVPLEIALMKTLLPFLLFGLLAVPAKAAEPEDQLPPAPEGKAHKSEGKVSKVPGVMDGFRTFSWDPAAFPDPAGLVADLAADGFQVTERFGPPGLGSLSAQPCEYHHGIANRFASIGRVDFLEILYGILRELLDTTLAADPDEPVP